MRDTQPLIIGQFSRAQYIIGLPLGGFQLPSMSSFLFGRFLRNFLLIVTRRLRMTDPEITDWRMDVMYWP